MTTNRTMLGNLHQSKIIELGRMNAFLTSEEFMEYSEVDQMKYIRLINELRSEIKSLSNEINSLSTKNAKLENELSRVVHDGSLWLGDVLEIEKPEFGTNNLIISPVGSGKTYAITEHLVPKGSKIQLLLVSLSHLKDSIAPNIKGDMKRKEDGINVFTSANKSHYGTGENKVWVMTYHEFGSRIRMNDSFVSEYGIETIYCDEIHSLIEQKKAHRSEALINAHRYLFQVTEGVTKFYFTATTEKLDELDKNKTTWFANVSTFDYSKYPDIKKYIAMNEGTFSHLNQLPEVLKSYKGDFKAYGKKGLFFSSKISTLVKMEKMLIEEGFSPITLWSKNNVENQMTDEQVAARDYIIEHNEIPEGYDFLLINQAMREGWNLNDMNVELVIINSTSVTDQIQARGRVRKNVASLILRTNEEVEVINELEVPENFLDTFLDSESKDELLSILNVVNDRGKRTGWTTVKKLLNACGYSITESRQTIDGKQVRVAKISKK